MSEYKSIGRERAIALVKMEWWKNKTARELAEFQMQTDELCMPCETFQEALTEAIGRPVLWHEIALNWQGIAKELFDGAPAPGFEDILNLIPEEQLIVIHL